MGKEKERRPSAWRKAEEELPENGQEVCVDCIEEMKFYEGTMKGI